MERRRSDSWNIVSKTGRKYSIDSSITTLGRANCDLNLSSRSVEKRHALLDWDKEKGALKLTDLDTTHGTFLNNDQLPADIGVELSQNDLLRFGLDPTTYEIVRMNSEDSLNMDRRSRSSDRSSGSVVDTNQQGADVEVSLGAIVVSTSASNSPAHRRDDHPILSPSANMPQQLYFPMAQKPPTTGAQSSGPYFYSHAMSQPALIYAQPMLVHAGGLYYAPTAPISAPGPYLYHQPMLAGQCPHHGQQPLAPMQQQISCPHCVSAPGNFAGQAYEEPLEIPNFERSDSPETEIAPEEPKAKSHHSHSSDGTTTPDHLKTQRYHVGAKLEKEHGRTPLFGAQPAWWGESDDDQHDQPLQPAITDNTRSRTPDPIKRDHSKTPPGHTRWASGTAVSDSETVTFRKPEPSSPPAGMGYGRRSGPAVRMDIPFTKPTKPVRKPHIQRSQTEASSATAFTIEFDDKQKKISLQEAVKRGRRQIRRSVPADMKSEPPDNNSLTDPKEYLLNKLLEGDESGDSSIENTKIEDDQLLIVSRRERHDSDVVSEAGTYVIDRESRSTNDLKVIEDEGIVYHTPEEGSRTPSPTLTLPHSEPVVSPRQSTTDNGQGDRKGLLRELLKMTQPSDDQIKKKTGPNSKPPIGQQRGSFSRDCAHKHQHKQTPDNTQFRRNDGGRFSMRVPTAPAPKWTPAGRSKPLEAPQQSPEMASWLRRKKYDPIKAAASAKQRKGSSGSSGNGSPYLANRSNTFHMGEAQNGNKKFTTQTSKELTRVGSEENISCEPESENIAAYSKNISQTLSKLVENSPDAEDITIETLEQLVSTSRGLAGEASKALNYLRCRRLSQSVEQLVRSVSSDSLESSNTSGSTKNTKQNTIDTVIAQMKNINLAFQAVNGYLSRTFPSEIAAPADSDTTPSDAGDIKISKVRPYRLKPFH